MIKKSRSSGSDFRNIWSYQPNGRFGIFRKLLALFLLISLTPIIFLGLYSLNILNDVGNTMAEQTTASLNRKIQDGLELQAVLTAKSMSVFLHQREKDLIHLREMVPDAQTFLHFYQQNDMEIWTRSGTNLHPVEKRERLALFKEISFVDPSGNEQIKIKNGQIVSKSKLKNVRDPKNTTYKMETYFAETIKLPRGGIYVSHLNGFYVSKSEQLGTASKVEDAVEGKQYDGVIRMATPIYRQGRLLGIVVLGIDHRHLMEFTQHILPNQKTTTVFPSYLSGNYAFMIDDHGWIITHPKYWDIPGVDNDGNWVPAFTQHSSAQNIEAGRIPFNLDSAAFIHKNYPFVSKQIREQKSGSVTTINVGGVTKIMAYAPIFYNTGEYANTGIFGGITVGAELKKFQLPAFFIGNSILEAIQLVQNNLIRILILVLLFSVLLSWLISRGITKPILKIMLGARDLALGKLDKNLQISRNDEVGVLATVFNFMAYELRKSRDELVNSYNRLKESKAEVEHYAEDLEYQLQILRAIQRISNILGSTFDMNQVIRLILQNCVETIGFDRAILYLLDADEKYLECKETFGFSEQGEEQARKSKINISRFDCIESRVAKEGKIIYVKDFKHYEQKSKLDRLIRKYGGSNSFVFIPLQVKENVIGILGADKKQSQDLISETDINSLQILANQASRVIETTQLYSELIEQKDFVEDILRYMVNGVLTVDSKGRITSINRAAVAILGIPKKEVLGQGARQVFKDQMKVVDEIRDRLGRRGFYSGYNLAYNSNQQNKFLNVNASTLIAHESYIIILEDVTERKHLDEHVARVERLASLGRFAAGLAHELRNPLTGVSILLDDLHDKLSAQPEVARMLALALDEIERLENLTSEVLDYANPNRGGYQLRDLNLLLESTLPFVEKQCTQSKITLDYQPPNESIKIRINPEKIRQALLNIILNAIQAQEKGGSIKIGVGYEQTENKNLQFENSADDMVVVIKISDSGAGIAEEDLTNIFEPFFTRRKGGTGLGLSMTQSIIAEHGGRIEVGSNIQGTTFTIYLPENMKTQAVDNLEESL